MNTMLFELGKIFGLMERRAAQPVVVSDDRLPFKESIQYPVKLAEGEVFLMGDNRPESEDSRAFGPVRAKDTLGELMTVIRSGDNE